MFVLTVEVTGLTVISSAGISAALTLEFKLKLNIEAAKNKAETNNLQFDFLKLFKMLSPRKNI
jgi:hypothetical protein